LPGGSLMGMLQRLADWARTPTVLLHRFAVVQEETVAPNGNGALPEDRTLVLSEFGERVLHDAPLESSQS
jgi:hypothetical protein